jgi:endonuclease YncB( thermonuclease family)
MIKVIIVCVLSMCSYPEALKDIKFDNVVVDKITSVYDGDTFRANIKGYPKIVGYRMSIRILGIDTPELKAKCKREKDLAINAKRLTASMLGDGKRIELRNIKRGKYFRILANVYVDGISIGDELIRNNLALEYDGGTKIDWCE